MAADQQIKNKRLKKLHIVNEDYVRKTQTKKQKANKIVFLAAFFIIIAGIYLFK